MLEVVGKMIPFLFCPVHFLFLAINESFGGLAAQSPAPEDQVAMARVKSWVGGGDKTLRFLVKVGSLEDQMGRFFVCVWLQGMECPTSCGIQKSGKRCFKSFWCLSIQGNNKEYLQKEKHHPNNANKEDLAESK